MYLYKILHNNHQPLQIQYVHCTVARKWLHYSMISKDTTTLHVPPRYYEHIRIKGSMISGFCLVFLTNIIIREVELIQGASDSAVLWCDVKVLRTCCIIPIWNLHKSIFESETCLKELNEAIADGVWYVYWTYYMYTYSIQASRTCHYKDASEDQIALQERCYETTI
jgi:hypothetical protein